MPVGIRVEGVQEREHLCGVPARAEDYEEVGWDAAATGAGWVRVEAGVDLEEAGLVDGGLVGGGEWEGDLG